MLGDRVRAVGTVWLGQTLGCCQCHDHKFDPALSRDFYSLGAFFADIRETAVGKREDGMNVPDEKQAVELARLAGAVEQIQQRIELLRALDLAAAQQAWEKAVLAELQEESTWTALHPDKVASEKNVQFKVDKDESILANASPKGGDGHLSHHGPNQAPRHHGLPTGSASSAATSRPRSWSRNRWHVRAQ